MTNMDGRKDLCKSAPTNGRRTSTTDQKKNSTIKEINGWIHKGNNDQMKRSGARNVSQLTENVTEERMLYARQLELGRERYKFLVSHEYEKQKFVERQQTKEKMMKKYMSSARKIIEKAYADKPKKTLTIRIPQVEFYTPSITPVDGELRAESRSSRTSGKSSMVPKLERRVDSRASCRTKASESSQRRHTDIKRAKEITIIESGRPESRNVENTCTTQLSRLQRAQTSGSGFYMNTSTDKDKPERLPSVSSQSNSMCCSRRQERSGSRQSRTKSSGSIKLSKGNSSKSKTDKPKTPNILDKISMAPKWKQSKREIKFGEKFGSSITDPRYVALESSLSPVNMTEQPNVEVKDIIANNYVLRTSGRCESAVSAKQLHAKFIAMLLEKDLSA